MNYKEKSQLQSFEISLLTFVVVQVTCGGHEVPHLPRPQHGEVPEGGRPTHPPRPHQVTTSQVGPLVDNKFPYDDGRTRIC